MATILQIRITDFDGNDICYCICHQYACSLFALLPFFPRLRKLLLTEMVYIGFSVAYIPVYYKNEYFLREDTAKIHKSGNLNK
jgi:hypothetical protein